MNNPEDKDKTMKECEMDKISIPIEVPLKDADNNDNKMETSEQLSPVKETEVNDEKKLNNEFETLPPMFNLCHVLNDIITQSPQKDEIIDMTEINVPDLNDFEKEILNRPHELTIDKDIKTEITKMDESF